ncbi:phosphatidylinositol 4-kinase alpha 2-like [Gossypium hirsutum]|uniref:Phosphatidylinositol 4-kinase alpha 2-like n=1 Tax=Gossypium hirsutum TaxID=3635 RepID=A0A1U8KV39_GOSHI|nr:phosphatidylinositol 4-kinase alpha 2-like [Gossypium hirsutum]
MSREKLRRAALPPVQENSSFLELLPIVRQHIIDGFTPKALDVFRREFDFFDKVTSISGVLFPLPKEERRAGIRRELEKIQVQGDDLYLPTAPNKLVCELDRTHYGLNCLHISTKFYLVPIILGKFKTPFMCLAAHVGTFMHQLWGYLPFFSYKRQGIL